MLAEDLPLIHSPYLSHHGNERAYIRDFILGVDDGMISTTLLATGVYASGMTSENIVLSIFSSALGDQISKRSHRCRTRTRETAHPVPPQRRTTPGRRLSTGHPPYY